MCLENQSVSYYFHNSLLLDFIMRMYINTRIIIFIHTSITYYIIIFIFIYITFILILTSLLLNYKINRYTLNVAGY
jgi:hypothetical protein